MHGTSECIAENELVSWAAGELSEARISELDQHVDVCEHCRFLVGEALRGSGATMRVTGTAVTFREGEIVAGRYHIDRFLARGGMGEVYEATDQWLKHRVALKTLLASVADEASALARLKIEVLTARQVSHRNVCRIFDFGFHTRRPTRRSGEMEQIAFLTMELLRGESLTSRLRRCGPFSEGEAFNVIRQLASGLANAHAAGIIHRDFKSDNVMLVETEGAERAVITDFGLARSALVAGSAPLTSSRHVLGTLDYMAPEQVLGESATAHSDLFALGVVVYEMLTGHLPFSGENAAARALVRTRKPPVPPSKWNAGISKRWEAAILRCLAIDPSARFPGPKDLIRALQDTAPARPGGSRVPWILAAVLGAAALGSFSIRSAPRDSQTSGGSPDVEPPHDTSPRMAVERPPDAPQPAVATAPLQSASAGPLPDVAASGQSAPTPSAKPRLDSLATTSPKSSSSPPVTKPVPRSAPSPEVLPPASPPAPPPKKAAANGVLNPFAPH